MIRQYAVMRCAPVSTGGLSKWSERKGDVLCYLLVL